MTAFFDTNILVYLADNRDARKQSIALDLVKAALTGRIDAWISAQALTEFANVALGKLKLPSEAVAGLLKFFEQLQTVNVQPSFARRGMEMRGRYGLQYYDSVMLAAAEQIGATAFYSEDLNSGQLYCGIRAVNPFESVRSV